HQHLAVVVEGRHLADRVEGPEAGQGLENLEVSQLVGLALHVQDAPHLVAEGRDRDLVQGDHEVRTPSASPSPVGSIVERTRPERARSSWARRMPRIAAAISPSGSSTMRPKRKALSRRTTPPGRRWSAAQAT